MSALELASAIRRREISSTEAVRASLDRIRELDPLLGAFTDVRARRALLDARRCDSVRSDAPFHGVPIGVKDLNLVRGTFTRFGSRSYRWLISPVDDTVATAVRRAGFVIVGKLATSEFGTLPVTETDIHPPTRNPWSPDRTAGGSSGGSGAAVAGGLLPIAHGSDGGGSIRIPAAFCHLFGFKSSRGLNPLANAKVDPNGLGVEGGLATTVDDAAAFTEVLAGRPVPACRPAPPRLRIRFTTDAVVAPTEPAYAEATERVARLLAEMGHDVERVRTVDGTVDEFLPLWTRLAADLPIPRESTLQPVNQWLRQQGRGLLHASVRDAHAALSAKVLSWCGDADLWLTPTVGAPPPRIGSLRGLAPSDIFGAIAPIAQFTAPFNVTGQPAASIPAGFTPDGMPIGVQLVGRHGEDALLLAVCRELEAAMPWRHARPAVTRR